jgi:hemoglobin
MGGITDSQSERLVLNICKETDNILIKGVKLTRFPAKHLMANTKHDILSNEDVTLLINEFYSKVRNDTQLAQHFAKVDWPHHTPIIVNFWRMILLGDQEYKGNPLVKHLDLKLTSADFDQWLLLFTRTVDELFQGEKAEEAKQRALSIASIFQHKMGIM